MTDTKSPPKQSSHVNAKKHVMFQITGSVSLLLHALLQSVHIVQKRILKSIQLISVVNESRIGCRVDSYHHYYRKGKRKSSLKSAPTGCKCNLHWIHHHLQVGNAGVRDLRFKGEFWSGLGRLSIGSDSTEMITDW